MNQYFDQFNHKRDKKESAVKPTKRYPVVPSPYTYVLNLQVTTGGLHTYHF